MWQETLRGIGALVFIFGVGVIAWAVARYIRRGTPPSDPKEEVVEWRSQILGWISAALFRECAYCLEVPRAHTCTKSERGFRK